MIPATPDEDIAARQLLYAALARLREEQPAAVLRALAIDAAALAERIEEQGQVRDELHG